MKLRNKFVALNAAILLLLCLGFSPALATTAPLGAEETATVQVQPASATAGPAEPVTPLWWAIPLHGHWCGPGHSGPVAPVDTLDALCMEHDRCYAKDGYFNLTCDLTLVTNVFTYFWAMSWDERRAVLFGILG